MPVSCSEATVQIPLGAARPGWRGTRSLVWDPLAPCGQTTVQLIDGLDGLPLARNPNVVDACAASAPL